MVVSSVVRHLIYDGQFCVGHSMGKWMCTDEMQLMVRVGSEWSHERRKGVAAAVDYLVKNFGYLKEIYSGDNLKASSN